MFFVPRSNFSVSRNALKLLRTGQQSLSVRTMAIALYVSSSVLLLNSPANAAQEGRRTTPALPSTSVNPDKSYRLGPEDVLDVRLSNHPQLSRTVTVRPDGKITFPRVGDVSVAGRSTSEVAARLKTLLERTLNNVRIEVELKTARPRLARVIGAVKGPNAYDLKPGWRVVDLIAAAGGLSAKPNRISGRIIRGGKLIPLDVAGALSQPAGAANFALAPDDLLILDESSVPYQVTVSGEIAKPGAYDLEEGLTLTKLLARAGGVGEDAALKKAQVLRGGQPIPLDISAQALKDPASPASRFTLQVGDVLVVPENQTRYGLLGQVVRPAYYPLPENRDDATIMKLLANSGGATPDADLRNASITRMVDGRPEVTTVDLRAILEGKAPDTVSLQPDDVLFVPRKSAQVHVIGQIGKPGAYELKDGMGLMSLISEAGSPSGGAGLSKAYILRDGTQIPLDLYRVLIEGKVDPDVSQLKLRSGDVLVIPDVSAQVHVIGQVAKPGAYKLEDRLTVASLIATAGNPLPEASLRKAYVLRDGTRLPLDLHSLMAGGQSNPQIENFRFAAGDVLVVPENQVRYAVMGQVARPGYFAYPEQQGEATVLKALAEAGGPIQGRGDGSANLKGAGIIRNVNGKAVIVPVDISALLQKGELANNMTLQPEDVLYIPPSKRGFKITDLLAGPLGALSMFMR